MNPDAINPRIHHTKENQPIMPDSLARLTNISSDLASPMAETALAAFTDFLNFHHEANDEDYRVDRAHYAMTPIILCAYAPMPTAEGNLDPHLSLRATLTILADPYGDEGGPSILTAFFDDFGNLAALIQEFDTIHTLILTEGKPTYTS